MVKRLRDSLWALLGQERSEAPQAVVERIRQAMLFALDAHCPQEQMQIDMAIRFAADVAELWYLRPELMAAIASCTNERVAQDALRDITALFKGHYGGSSTSRFGSL